MSSHRALAAVCLPVPLDREFTYDVPETLRAKLIPGQRVRVPFSGRSAIGWFVGFADPPPPRQDGTPVQLQAIEELLDETPLLDESMLGLGQWIAETYACGWGEALAACIPAGVRSGTTAAQVRYVTAAVEQGRMEAEIDRLAVKQPKRSRVLRIVMECPDGVAVRDLARAAQCSESPILTLVKHGLLQLEQRDVAGDAALDGMVDTTPPPDPTAEQSNAIASIAHALDGERAETFLLHGVTGSGKTEVYLRAIAHCLAQGRQAIVLVPEIALTPQTVARFRGRFERVAVLHSALSDAERRRQWLRIRDGGADVVIGPRSAIFAPLPRVGLIVLDEEHESSFKQQSSPRYHARRVAVERCRRTGACLVLGSATPSLESWRDATEGRLTLLSLPSRVGGGRLPRVDVIDMVTEGRETKRNPLLSRRLVTLLRQAHRDGRQALLLLNRRGFATTLFCNHCGGTLECTRCSVARTFHRGHGTVLCHACGDERVAPRICPGCSAPSLSRLGAGTERLEDVVHRALPGTRVARMDSDVMHDAQAYERVLGAFGRGEHDVLLGTQMIAKGLHFPGVTVVGVVSADTALLLPDFRSAERTFQLVAQVAGRAGRTDARGAVVVQSIQPKHPALVAAARHDFIGFAERELEERGRYGWPPFSRLVRAVISGRDPSATAKRAQQIAEIARASLPSGAGDVLGPSRCPIERVRDRHRMHVVLRCADEPVQRAVVARLRKLGRRSRGTDLMVDVDPVDLS